MSRLRTCLTLGVAVACLAVAGWLLPGFRMERADDTDPGLELAINLRSKRDIFLRPSVR